MNGKKGKKSSIIENINSNFEHEDNVNNILDNEFPINIVTFKIFK